MKKIIFDTETTGMFRGDRNDVAKGHYIVELGAIKIQDRRPTGEELHLFFKPKIKMDEEVIRIHQITNEFLADKPSFAEQLAQIEEFFDDPEVDEIIAHNIAFDQCFMNTELKRAKSKLKLIEPRFVITDSLKIARQSLKDIKKHNLDALCKYYNIDTSERESEGHGALLDSKLLLKVWLKLTGGQHNLFAENQVENTTENRAEKRFVEVENQTSSQAKNKDEELDQAAEKIMLLIQKNNTGFSWKKIENKTEDIELHQKILEKIRA
ncbi:MAG: DNA polymerase III subunit epsilon [Cardiobacteriaceae bacterium]|nr:DNA polymerase III subunit epsilon [Cardiobacteriaceae bacterium]